MPLFQLHKQYSVETDGNVNKKREKKKVLEEGDRSIFVTIQFAILLNMTLSSTVETLLCLDSTYSLHF
jgi:hypothetical protein